MHHSSALFDVDAIGEERLRDEPKERLQREAMFGVTILLFQKTRCITREWLNTPRIPKTGPIRQGKVFLFFFF